MIWFWKRKMTVLQMLILFHFVLRFILSFWFRWAIPSVRLVFPVSPRCEEGLNCVFLSGVLQELRNLFLMLSVKGTRFPSSNYRHLFSRRTMLRRFLTIPLCPKLLMNCSTLTLLKRFFCVRDIVSFCFHA